MLLNSLKFPSTSVPQLQTLPNYPEDSFSKTCPDLGKTKKKKKTLINSSKLKKNLFLGQLSIEKIGTKK